MLNQSLEKSHRNSKTAKGAAKHVSSVWGCCTIHMVSLPLYGEGTGLYPVTPAQALLPADC